MKNSTRRNFLQKGALASLGTAAASGVALGQTEAETELRSADRELAKVLRSYGRTNALKQDGFEKVKVGPKTKQLPVSRVGIRVSDQQSFCASFEKLTSLSERVHVDGNTVKFARGGQFYVLENHVA